MATKSSASTSIAACALRVRLGEALQRLIPAGEFTAPRGAMSGTGPWFLTPAGAARIIADNASRTTDLVVDYEHQTLLAERNGQPAPAAGWIDPRSLVFRAEGDEPGLYGAVHWTSDASAQISADEYRYLSPVFPYDADTGEVLGLMHVGLTNTPGIDEPIRAALSARFSSFHHQENPVNELLKKLLAALGLPETTSEADAIAGVAALKVRADEAQNQIAALKSAAPDPTKYVPVATFEAERAERIRLAALTAEGEVSKLIKDALDAGILLENQREYAETLGKADVAALRGFLGAGAPFAALKGMQTGGKPPAGAGGQDGALDDAAVAVCKQLGLSAEEFKKAKIGG